MSDIILGGGKSLEIDAIKVDISQIRRSVDHNFAIASKLIKDFAKSMEILTEEYAKLESRVDELENQIHGKEEVHDMREDG